MALLCCCGLPAEQLSSETLSRVPALHALRHAGSVFHSCMEGSELGVLESWRFMRGNSMAVRTALRPARGGPEVRRATGC